MGNVGAADSDASSRTSDYPADNRYVCSCIVRQPPLCTRQRLSLPLGSLCRATIAQISGGLHV